VVENTSIDLNGKNTKPKRDLIATERDNMSQAQIDELSEKILVVRKLEGLSRAQDVFTEATPDMAKVLVMEAHFSKSSRDRITAANAILDRELGKPMQRNVNMNVSVSDKNDHELDAEIGDLLEDLGMKKRRSNNLIIDVGESGQTGREGKTSAEAKDEKGSTGQDKT